MTRGEIYWADLGADGGRRPVVVLTRDSAIEVRRRVTRAPLTRTVRNIASEVPVGRREAVDRSVVSCDNLLTIPKSSLGTRPLGRLSLAKRVDLDRALRYALDISY